MKTAILLAAFAAVALSEVTVDYTTLKTTGKVEFSDQNCGEWDNYKCCSKKNECKDLKQGGSDKKTKKKRERERDRHCVKDSESCCGADLHYNWKRTDNDEATDFDRDAGKNTKQCDKDEVCVATHLLSKSDEGAQPDASTTKTLIGDKTSTKCMKKDKYKKALKKTVKKYKKTKESEKEKANKEFSNDVRITEIMDQGHRCGDFDKTIKCCHPDKNFCDQIEAEDKDKYCVKKDKECCTNFIYSESDRSIIEATQNAAASECKKDSNLDTCVVSDHDSSANKVTVKCWYKKLAKTNKYRKKKKKGGSDNQDLIDMLTGNDQDPLAGLF